MKRLKVTNTHRLTVYTLWKEERQIKDAFGVNV
ncbi:hypothetical protein PG301_19610 [Parageobacillus sp. G301]|nr:hypothetical protein PG301_19610 [Parageobacillus sp. G301]